MNVLGDPLFNLLGPVAGDTENPESLEKIDAAKAEYHLDDPLPVRYVKWLGDFVTGDFGVQFSTDGQPPVSDLLKERVPRSLMLLVMAQTFAVVDLDPVGAVGGLQGQQTGRPRVDADDLPADRDAQLRAGRDPAQVPVRDQARRGSRRTIVASDPLLEHASRR